MNHSQDFPEMTDLEVAALSAAGVGFPVAGGASEGDDDGEEEDSSSSSDDSSEDEDCSSDEENDADLIPTSAGGEERGDRVEETAMAENGGNDGGERSVGGGWLSGGAAGEGLPPDREQSAGEGEGPSDGGLTGCDVDMAPSRDEAPAAGEDALPPADEGRYVVVSTDRREPSPAPVAAPAAGGTADGDAGFEASGGEAPGEKPSPGDSKASDEVESDSDSMSSSDTDSSNDVNFPENIREMIDKSDSDDEGGVFSKNEVKQLPPPDRINLKITEEEEVKTRMVIATASSKRSILTLPDRTLIGRIEEVFGPVQAPFYITRYAGEDPSPPAALQIGAKLMVATKHCDYVIQEQLYVKGYDNSGRDDEETGEVDFSDDEKEAEYRKQLKTSKRKASGGAAMLPPDMLVAQHSSEGPGSAPAAAGRGRGGGRGRGPHTNPRHSANHLPDSREPQQWGAGNSGVPRPPMMPFPSSPYSNAMPMGMMYPPGMSFNPAYAMGPQQMMYGMGPQSYGFNTMGYNPYGGPMPPVVPPPIPPQQQQYGYGNQDQAMGRGRGRGRYGGGRAGR